MKDKRRSGKVARPPFNWTQEKVEFLLNNKDTMSMEELANYLGTWPHTVKARLTEMNVKRTNKKPTHRLYNKSSDWDRKVCKETINILIKQRLSITQIAKKMKLSQWRVTSAVKHLGLSHLVEDDRSYGSIPHGKQNVGIVRNL